MFTGTLTLKIDIESYGETLPIFNKLKLARMDETLNIMSFAEKLAKKINDSDIASSHIRSPDKNLVTNSLIVTCQKHVTRCQKKANK